MQGDLAAAGPTQVPILDGTGLRKAGVPTGMKQAKGMAGSLYRWLHAFMINL